MSNATDPRRRYLTHDCDQGRVELVVLPPQGNGDWYVSIVPAGAKFWRLAPHDIGEPHGGLPATVRVTTSGERKEHRHVARAVSILYAALDGESASAEDFADLVRLRLELHRHMVSSGRGDSAEADALRDQMDALDDAVAASPYRETYTDLCGVLALSRGTRPALPAPAPEPRPDLAGVLGKLRDILRHCDVREPSCQVPLGAAATVRAAGRREVAELIRAIPGVEPQAPATASAAVEPGDDATVPGEAVSLQLARRILKEAIEPALVTAPSAKDALDGLSYVREAIERAERRILEDHARHDRAERAAAPCEPVVADLATERQRAAATIRKYESIRPGPLARLVERGDLSAWGALVEINVHPAQETVDALCRLRVAEARADGRLWLKGEAPSAPTTAGGA